MDHARKPDSRPLLLGVLAAVLIAAALWAGVAFAADGSSPDSAASGGSATESVQNEGDAPRGEGDSAQREDCPERGGGSGGTSGVGASMSLGI